MWVYCFLVFVTYSFRFAYLNSLKVIHEIFLKVSEAIMQIITEVHTCNNWDEKHMISQQEVYFIQIYNMQQQMICVIYINAPLSIDYLHSNMSSCPLKH